MSTRYANILRAVAQTPWAIQEHKLDQILALLTLRANGGEVSDAEVAAFAASNRRPTATVKGAIAVLPLYGVIAQRMSGMSAMSGGTSTDLFGAQFQDALDNPAVGAIVLDIDSPGGTVQGVAELAARIYKARGTKPIYGVANSLAASAAYWIAAACDEVVVTPSGEVGSIGVFVVHTDTSEMDAADGVKHTIIKAGKYKAEGNPFEPLSDVAKANIQEYVNGFYGMFVNAVARYRGTSVGAVKTGYGEGRCITANDAVAAGMADRVATLEDVIAELGAKPQGLRKRAAALEERRVAALEDLRGLLDDPAVVAAIDAGASPVTAAVAATVPVPTLQLISSVDTAAREIPMPPVPAAAPKAKESTMPETLAPVPGADSAEKESTFDAFLALAKQNKDVLEGDALDTVAKWRASGASLESVKSDLLAKHTAKAKPIAVSGVHDRRQDAKFASFGEQLLAIRAAARGLPTDPRLIGLNEIYGAASGGSEQVPSDGGFLLQTDFSNELISHAFNQGEVLKRVRKIPIGPGMNGIRINAIDETSRVTGSRFGGVQSFWVNEADAATAKKPTFRRINMELEKLIGLYYATDEILQDTTALSAIAMQAFSEELIFMVEDGIVNGIGGAQPLGILNAGCLVTQPTSSGGTNTIKIADVTGMYSRMLPRSLSSSVWLVSQSTWPQLMQLAIGTFPVFMPAQAGVASAAEAPYGSLFGRPIVPVEYCAQLGTIGDIIFADLSSYVLIEKGGPTTAQSVHVRFVNDETAFRFTYRVNGQPWYAAAITPYKGANTWSPFIAFTSTRT